MSLVCIGNVQVHCQEQFIFFPYFVEKLHGKLVVNISLNKHWVSVNISNITESAITDTT